MLELLASLGRDKAVGTVDPAKLNVHGGSVALGHPFGDRILEHTAERLRGLVREADVVTRLGGDEFAVILHGVTDPAPAGTIPPSANATMSATSAPPTSTTTATSPPTTSTPTTPTGPEGLPAAAKQRTESGGVAFVKRYWEVFNETATTPRVGILPTYSLPTCKTCVYYEERRRNLIKYDVRYDRALNTNGDAEPVCGAGYADPCAADPSLGPGPATAIWGRELSPSTGQPLSTVWARLGVTCLLEDGPVERLRPLGVRELLGTDVRCAHQ